MKETFSIKPELNLVEKILSTPFSLTGRQYGFRHESEKPDDPYMEHSYRLNNHLLDDCLCAKRKRDREEIIRDAAVCMDNNRLGIVSMQIESVRSFCRLQAYRQERISQKWGGSRTRMLFGKKYAVSYSPKKINEMINAMEAQGYLSKSFGQIRQHRKNDKTVKYRSVETLYINMAALLRDLNLVDGNKRRSILSYMGLFALVKVKYQGVKMHTLTFLKWAERRLFKLRRVNKKARIIKVKPHPKIVENRKLARFRYVQRTILKITRFWSHNATNKQERDGEWLST